MLGTLDECLFERRGHECIQLSVVAVFVGGQIVWVGMP